MNRWTSTGATRLVVASALVAVGLARPVAAQGPAQGQIVAIQGRVEHTPPRQEAWTPATLKQPLFVAERVRTQAESRAAILFVDETQVRLNAGAVLTVQEVKRGTGAPTLLDLTKGEGWFRTKNPASGLTVKTPAASAAIRGTEINIQINPGDEAVLTVVEGAAEFFNDFGRVVATVGTQAVARPGQAPVLRTLLNPEDAVQWALYYPAAAQWGETPAEAGAGAGAPGFARLGAGDPAGALEAWQGAAPNDPWVAVGRAAALTRLGRIEEARAALDTLPASGLGAQVDAARRTQRAATALASGDVATARREIDAVLAADATALRALLLQASLALTTNRKDEARVAADRALAAHPQSPAALVAAAEVAQAEFDLRRARELLDRALAAGPGHVPALVNRARLRFGSGDTKGARADIGRAAGLAADDPQVRSLSGFIRLADGDLDAAQADFERAVAGDASFGEPHLGLGLLAFRRGEEEAGLRSMLTATLLEPKVSLYQSYLGKAYYQAKRFPEGLAALRSAKALDPRDPTPWLYASLFERDQYRQTAALEELRQAIARNDNRAVYRSRLLLDRDEATTNVSLAEVYRDLGFGAWGAYEALNSVETDLTNAGAHLFLGDTYGVLPDRTQALSSELLQFFLYSPVNRNSFNTFSEYTALLEQPYRSLSVVGGVGTPDRTRANFVTRSGNERFAHYAFVEQNREAGARPGIRDDNLQAFAQAKLALGAKTDVFGSVSAVDREFGQDRESVQRFGADIFSTVLLRQFRSDRDPNLVNRYADVEGTLGVKHMWRTGSAFTAAARINDLKTSEEDPDATTSACSGFELTQFGARSTYRLDLPFRSYDVQLQQATRLGRHQVIVGAQAFTQDKSRRCHETVYSLTTSETLVLNEASSGKDHTYRGYARDEIQVTRNVHATLGVSYDDVRYQDNISSARYDVTRWNPVVGVTARLTPSTMLRVAAFRNLNNDISGARISPTTVSGFVLERNEFPTAERREVGASLEHGWDRWFAGVRGFYRETEVPALLATGSLIPEADTNARGFDAYANWLVARRFTIFAQNLFIRTNTRAFDRNDNQARVGFSFVHESGLIARVSGGYLTQRFPVASVTGLPESGFGLADTEVSYEFARKHGLLTLTVNNLFNRDFRYIVEGVSVEQPQPVRRLLATLRWRI